MTSLSESCDLSIIIPVKADARVWPTVDAVKTSLGSSIHYEILVCGDEQETTFDPVVRLLSVEPPTKGNNAVQGVQNALGRVILLMDADCPIDASEIPDIIARLEHFDVVLGKRHRPVRPRSPYQWSRLVLSYLFRMVVRLMFGTAGIDTQCGVKAFRAGAARGLYSNLLTKNFVYEIEVVLGIRRAGLRCANYPVPWRYSRNSTLRMADDVPQAVSDLGRIWLKTLRGRVPIVPAPWQRPRLKLVDAQ